MQGALRPAHGVDAAVHHAHPDPVPGGVEGRSLAPLVGHRVVAVQRAGFGVGLQRQIPAPHLTIKRTATQKRTRVALVLEGDRNTYGVEQSEQSAGAQAAARGQHVGQFEPDVPPGIISLHQGQRMLPVSEHNQGKGDIVTTVFSGL